MTPASILLAFLSILLPGVIVYAGVWLLARRDRRIQAAQDRDREQQDARAEGMASMRRPRRLRVISGQK